MTSSINRILLIGDGAWSRKINGVILAQNVDFEVEVISARAFISMRSDLIEFAETCEKFDLFWITTTPRNQIQILRQLGKTHKKIILDKPIATNVIEIDLIQDLIRNSQCKIYLSQPWTYSDLWSKMKTIILSIKGEVLIQAERGGSLVRKEFPPEIDWTPHDIYLLADYAVSLETNYRHTNLVFREKNDQHILLKYKVGQEQIFEISAGYATERKALWRAYSHGKLLAEVNFDSGEFTDHRGLDPIKFAIKSENPIMAMLSFISENEPTVDWNLILNLYRDLVGVSY